MQPGRRSRFAARVDVGIDLYESAFGEGAFDVDTERADVGIGPYGLYQ